MITLLVWLGIATAVAAGVLAFTGAASAARSDTDGGFFADLRAGFASWRARRSGTADPDADLDTEPVEVSLGEFLAAASTDEEAYVQAAGMQHTLEIATDAVSGAVNAITRR